MDNPLDNFVFKFQGTRIPIDDFFFRPGLSPHPIVVTVVGVISIDDNGNYCTSLEMPDGGDATFMLYIKFRESQIAIAFDGEIIDLSNLLSVECLYESDRDLILQAIKDYATEVLTAAD